MKDPILEPILQSLRERRPPSCPAALEANVLRRIRLSRTDSRPTLFLQTLPGRSSAVTAAAAVAVLLGATTALLSTTAEAKQRAEHRMTVRALDFDVFRDHSLRAAVRRSP